MTSSQNVVRSEHHCAGGSRPRWAYSLLRACLRRVPRPCPAIPESACRYSPRVHVPSSRHGRRGPVLRGVRDRIALSFRPIRRKSVAPLGCVLPSVLLLIVTLKPAQHRSRCAGLLRVEGQYSTRVGPKADFDIRRLVEDSQHWSNRPCNRLDPCAVGVRDAKHPPIRSAKWRLVSDDCDGRRPQPRRDGERLAKSCKHVRCHHLQVKRRPVLRRELLRRPGARRCSVRRRVRQSVLRRRDHHDRCVAALDTDGRSPCTVVRQGITDDCEHYVRIIGQQQLPVLVEVSLSCPSEFVRTPLQICHVCLCHLSRARSCVLPLLQVHTSNAGQLSLQVGSLNLCLVDAEEVRSDRRSCCGKIPKMHGRETLEGCSCRTGSVQQVLRPLCALCSRKLTPIASSLGGRGSASGVS